MLLLIPHHHPIMMNLVCLLLIGCLFKAALIVRDKEQKVRDEEERYERFNALHRDHTQNDLYEHMD